MKPRCVLFSNTLTVIGGLLLLTISGAQQANKTQAPARTADTAAKTARYIDADGKMSFVPPTGWQRSKQIPPPTIVYVAPDVQDQSINIGVVSEPVGNVTLDQFIKSNRDFANQTRGLTIYAIAPTTLAGDKAMTWRMHVKLPKGAPHETRQVFCIHDKRSYVLTLAGLPSNIKKYDLTFDKVVASFQWEK